MFITNIVYSYGGGFGTACHCKVYFYCAVMGWWGGVGLWGLCCAGWSEYVVSNYSDFQSQVCSWFLFELNFGDFIMGCFALLLLVHWFHYFFCIIFLYNLIFITV